MILKTDYLALVLLSVALLVLRHYSKQESRTFRLFVNCLTGLVLLLWAMVLLLSL